MPVLGSLALKKEERICSKKLIEELFTRSRSLSMTSYPVRLIYMQRERREAGDPPAVILVSVPKRHLKRAVDRNRVKRQIREAYRKNKALMTLKLDEDMQQLVIAFVWLDNKVFFTNRVEQCIVNLLTRLSEKP